MQSPDSQTPPIAQVERGADERHSMPVWATRDHYELLEVHRDATQSDLDDARKLQRAAWHPDRFKGSERVGERFKAIEIAYQTLSDAVERRKYDAKLLPNATAISAFPDPQQRDGLTWKQMARWMKEQNVGTSYLRKMAFSAGDLVEKYKRPTDRQLPYMLQAWETAIAAGFKIASLDR